MGKDSKALHLPPSLSKSALMLSPCIAWAGPQARWFNDSLVKSDKTYKRDRGVCFHEMIADEILTPGSGKRDHDFGSSLDVLFDHATVYWHKELFPQFQQYYIERACGVNWTTGEAAEYPLIRNREYPHDNPLFKGFQFGTADIAGVTFDNELVVADWKTGGSDGAYYQLMSLACVFNKTAFAPDKRPKNIILLTLSVSENGVFVKHCERTQADLEVHWNSMKFQWEDKDDGMAPVPGIHCTAGYCPHLAYCPAVTKELQTASQAPAARVRLPLATESHVPTDDPRIGGRWADDDQEAGRTMAMVSAAKRQGDYLTEGMKRYISEGGRVISDGYEWSKGNDGFRWRKSK